MSYFRGEYWIVDGDVDFADGDVGDRNHEGIAAEHAAHQLADLCSVDYDSDAGYEGLDRALIEYASELGGEDAEELPDNGMDAAYAILRSEGKNPDEYHDLVAIALQCSSSDPRAYAMKHWGWIWCQKDWFGMAKLDDTTRDSLIKGIWSILEENGYYEDDGESAFGNPLDHQIHIQTLDGKSIATTLHELETGQASSKQTKTPLGPNAQLHDIDVQGQPAHYGTNLGDSRALRILNNLLEAV